MSKSVVALMSYVRLDDQHENGRLSELFRRRLSGEVKVQTGEEFHIFQDRNDIEWGQQWQQLIDESLDAVTFLIPIIAPSFFNSPASRNELQRFLDREERLNRNDLILPVYYVTCPILTDPAKLEADSLAKVIAARQHSDWRDLRFEVSTSPEVGKKLAEMATQITKVLQRGQPEHRAAASVPAAAKGESAPGLKTEPRTPKIEPPTLVVDALCRGNYPTLTDALQACQTGHQDLGAACAKSGVGCSRRVDYYRCRKEDPDLGYRRAVYYYAELDETTNLHRKFIGETAHCTGDPCRPFKQSRTDNLESRNLRAFTGRPLRTFGTLDSN